MLNQRVVEEFRELSGQKLTESMDMFHKYLIEVKKASAQVAFTAMAYNYTVERRSYYSEPTNKLRSREVQLNMWLVLRTWKLLMRTTSAHSVKIASIATLI